MDRCKRSGPPGSALIENDDPIKGRIEETAVRGIGSGARSAVQKYDRDTGRIAGLFIVQPMPITDVEHPSFVRLDLWKEVHMTGCCVHGSTLNIRGLMRKGQSPKASEHRQIAGSAHVHAFGDADVFRVVRADDTVANREVDNHQRRVELEVIGFPHSLDNLFDRP